MSEKLTNIKISKILSETEINKVIHKLHMEKHLTREEINQVLKSILNIDKLINNQIISNVDMSNSQKIIINPSRLINSINICLETEIEKHHLKVEKNHKNTTYKKH